MVEKVPLHLSFDGNGDPSGLSEFQTGEVVPDEHLPNFSGVQTSGIVSGLASAPGSDLFLKYDGTWAVPGTTSIDASAWGVISGNVGATQSPTGDASESVLVVSGIGGTKVTASTSSLQISSCECPEPLTITGDTGDVITLEGGDTLEIIGAGGALITTEYEPGGEGSDTHVIEIDVPDATTTTVGGVILATDAEAKARTDGNEDVITCDNLSEIVKDEDDMASNSVEHLATQQSIKTYVDDTVSQEATTTTVGVVTLATDTEAKARTDGVKDVITCDNLFEIVKDEDNMASNSVEHLATQQSIKAYVDNLANQEAIEDVVGGMLGGTETFIAVTYNESNNINFVVPVHDEDDMASDSATDLATQQSIKAYVDAQSHAETVQGNAPVTVTESPTDTFTVGIDFDVGVSEKTVLASDDKVLIQESDGTHKYTEVTNFPTPAAGVIVAWKNIAVAGQSNVVADTAVDTLTLVAGTGMTLTTDDTTDSVTFSSETGALLTDGSNTMTGDVLLGSGVDIIFEGTTNDNFETTLSATNPTADRTLTLPDATDTIVGRATTDTLTNKTLGTNSTWNGNVITSSYIDTGIADGKIVKIDQVATAVDNEFAKFTANGLEGRSFSEVKTDLGLVIGTDVLAEQTIGIANNNLVEIDDADDVTGDYAKFTANGLEGLSSSEVLSDIGAGEGDFLADGTVAMTGDVLLGSGVDIIFEGATNDAFETTLTVTDPTVDRTLTLPDATDTIVGRETTDTLTNKTLTSPTITEASLDGATFSSGTGAVVTEGFNASMDGNILLWDPANGPLQYIVVSDNISSCNFSDGGPPTIGQTQTIVLINQSTTATYTVNIGAQYGGGTGVEPQFHFQGPTPPSLAPETAITISVTSLEGLIGSAAISGDDILGLAYVSDGSIA